MFLQVSVCPQWGRHAWLQGGTGCAWLCGACMVARGQHAWLLGGMHGCRGACVVAGGAWLWGGACVVVGGVCMAYDEIRSMSGQYASYWNAFLLRSSFFQQIDLCLIPELAPLSPLTITSLSFSVW